MGEPRVGVLRGGDRRPGALRSRVRAPASRRCPAPTAAEPLWGHSSRPGPGRARTLAASTSLDDSRRRQSAPQATQSSRAARSSSSPPVVPLTRDPAAGRRTRLPASGGPAVAQYLGAGRAAYRAARKLTLSRRRGEAGASGGRGSVAQGTPAARLAFTALLLRDQTTLLGGPARPRRLALGGPLEGGPYQDADPLASVFQIALLVPRALAGDHQLAGGIEPSARQPAQSRRGLSLKADDGIQGDPKFNF